MKQSGWIKIYSETYENSIVGNESGLSALKDAIDSALNRRQAPIAKHCQADFKSVLLTNDQWHETEVVELPRWKKYTFITILAFWTIALPIAGIFGIYSYIFS
ncbi:MAG: hypothetical protein ABW162_17855 [Candidatus Sedimenticola sp. PURPLELP]